MKRFVSIILCSFVAFILCMSLVSHGDGQSDESSTPESTTDIVVQRNKEYIEHEKESIRLIYNLFQSNPEILKANDREYVIYGRHDVYDLTDREREAIGLLIYPNTETNPKYSVKNKRTDEVVIDYILFVESKVWCDKFSKSVYSMFGLGSQDGKSYLVDIGYYVDMQKETAYSGFTSCSGTNEYLQLPLNIAVSYNTAVNRGYIEDKKDYSFSPYY